jgi:hypothetical protein
MPEPSSTRAGVPTFWKRELTERIRKNAEKRRTCLSGKRKSLTLASSRVMAREIRGMLQALESELTVISNCQESEPAYLWSPFRARAKHLGHN